MKGYQSYVPRNEDEVYDTFSKRVIKLTGAGQVLKGRFSSPQEEDEFFIALGRLVTHGFGQEGPGTSDQAHIHINLGLSLAATYSRDEDDSRPYRYATAILSQDVEDREEVEVVDNAGFQYAFKFDYPETL